MVVFSGSFNFKSEPLRSFFGEMLDVSIPKPDGPRSSVSAGADFGMSIGEDGSGKSCAAFSDIDVRPDGATDCFWLAIRPNPRMLPISELATLALLPCALTLLVDAVPWTTSTESIENCSGPVAPIRPLSDL